MPTRTSCASEPPAAAQTAVRFSNTRRVCARDVAGDELAGRGIERDLAGQINRVAGADGLRIRADRLRRAVGVDDLSWHRGSCSQCAAGFGGPSRASIVTCAGSSVARSRAATASAPSITRSRLPAGELREVGIAPAAARELGEQRGIFVDAVEARPALRGCRRNPSRCRRGRRRRRRGCAARDRRHR